MNNDSLKQVFDALSETPLGKRMGDYSLSVICPICGEDGKHRDHSHCYVGLIDGGPPLVYHCWINDCSGVVTPDFLHDMNIFDLELDNIVNIFNRSNGYNRLADNKIYRVKKARKEIVIPDFRADERKLDYMRKRLGVNFSYDNLKSLKVIGSLYDFLNINKLDLTKRYKKYGNVLDRDYVGFVSTQNDWVILRNTNPGNNMLRYVKYDVFDLLDKSNIIYTLPGTSNDIFADEVELNVCEGTFDALGVFCHIKKYNRTNSIYAACCGSGYINTIRYFIRLGFVGNLVVNIYSDSDKRPKFYKNMDLASKIRPWVKDIRLFYNERSKDYGVPGNYILIAQARTYGIL